MEVKNTMFYTDVIEQQTNLDVLNIKFDIKTLLDKVDVFYDEIKTGTDQWKADGIKDIYATLCLKDNQIVCFLSGAKPWTDDKIKEYESAVSEEKDEMKTLQALIEKHPQKAFQLFSKVMLDKYDIKEDK